MFSPFNQFTRRDRRDRRDRLAVGDRLNVPQDKPPRPLTASCGAATGPALPSPTRGDNGETQALTRRCELSPGFFPLPAIDLEDDYDGERRCNSVKPIAGG